MQSVSGRNVPQRFSCKRGLNDESKNAIGLEYVATTELGGSAGMYEHWGARPDGNRSCFGLLAGGGGGHSN